MNKNVGVLFLNIGTPDAPTEDAVREYLAEFLSDPYVVDYPRWLWNILLKFIILRNRPAKSARLYAIIWQESGSPLLHITESLSEKVAVKSIGYHTAVGMRYGQPSIKSALQYLKRQNIEHLVIFPLFPQNSSSTTQTAIEHTDKILNSDIQFNAVTVVEDYHQESAYIKALATSIKEDWRKNGKPEKLLFSFHGVPLRYITRKGEDYKRQCEKTAELVANNLGLVGDEYLVSFQSRFGPEKWLEPYTDETLRFLGEKKCQSLAVICPGFAVDCLETLEEIAIEGKSEYEAAGGNNFRYIPALNDGNAHVDALLQIIENTIE